MFQTFREILGIFKSRDRRTIYIIAGLQIALGLLDILGIGLIGVVGAISVTGVSSRNPQSSVAQLLETLHLDDLTFQGQVAALTFAAAFFLILKTGLSVFFTRRSLYFLSSKSSQLATAAISHLLTLPISDVRKFNTQTVMHIVNGGINSIVLGVVGTGVSVVADLSLLALLGLSLFLVSPLTALISLFFYLAIALFLYLMLHKRAEVIGQEDSKRSIAINDELLEALMSYRELSVRNRNWFYIQRLEEKHNNLTSILAERTFMPNISKYVIEISVVIGAVLISAVQFIFLEAESAVATLAIFIAAGSRIAPAALRIQQSLLQMKTSFGVGKESLEFIQGIDSNRISKIQSSSFQDSHEYFIPRVEINEMDFKYSNSNKFALESINILIEPGETVAFVGESGAGKSSLVDAILGLITPSSGKIRISGMSPSEAIRNFPGAISYVPQEIFMFNKTLKENICLGYLPNEINHDNIHFAVLKSALVDFVNGLPKGLDTQIGDLGFTLSGGQKQRIGIARALLSKPKLLILDEATSSLDGIAENLISESINELEGNCTTIVIAHRISTIREIKKIVYLKEGRVLHVGNFGEVRKAVPEFDRQASLMGL